MLEDEKAFRKSFFEMTQMVKFLYEERNTRLQGEGSKPPKGEGSSRGKRGDEDKPPKVNGDKPSLTPPLSSPPSSPPCSPSSSSITTPSQTRPHSLNRHGKTPFLKLDIKFHFPMYDGEINVERIDNWVCQLEVFCKIQRIKDDDTKIQLDSLILESETLIWCEAKTQEEMKKHGKVLTPWNDFVAALRRQFYPLAYMQKCIMDWQDFRQGKGQSVQKYTQEFRRRELILGVDLTSQETLLKYIGGFHCYLRHTFLRFNRTNLDEFCVQATHLEARGKHVSDEKSERSLEIGEKGNGMFKGKRKNNASIKMEKEKITCKHYLKYGHDDDHCWKLHPEMRSNKLKNKEKEKTTTIIQHDLGFGSEDEPKITTTGLKDKDIVSTNSSSFPNDTQNEETRIELFHVRVISKHTKTDTLFDSGSQENIIS